MSSKAPEIDFILTYLDGNDVEWQKERNKYTPGKQADVNPNRYRNWDNLQYFFRGVEKFAPWVRKVHLVTCGHVPAWLNLEHPKLNIVKHSDYIPAEWLPTFSSRCIDMNFQRIPELAEHFVYFNDDMFITRPVSPEDFFRDGKPVEAAVLTPQAWGASDTVALHIAPIVNTAVINRHFKKKNVIRQHPFNWLNFRYGKDLLRSLNMMPYPHFVGFMNYHLPYPYLKSTYEKVWAEEEARLTETVSHRFREITDMNHWIFNYWQFATNSFAPRSVRDGQLFQLHKMETARRAEKAVRGQKYKMVCLNDALNDNGDFPEMKRMLNGALDSILPERSGFEKA